MTTTTTTTTTLMRTITKEIALVASQNSMVEIEYTANSASIVQSNVFSSVINQIILGKDNDKVYISTNNDLNIYSNDYYVNDNESKELLKITNSNRDIMNTYNGFMWSVQSYNGKVTKLNATTLDVLKIYSNFDAPFKIRYSDYHASYFVAGTNILWKLDDVNNVVSVAYEVNDYRIKDFDVSESGEICLILDGNSQDIIRILKNDVYSFVLNKVINNENVKYCKYCNKGRFYILSELYSSGSIYSASHYIFNLQNNTIERVVSDSSNIITTTTTTLMAISKAVQLSSPMGGELIQSGKQYDIKWISSKSVTDFVKLELYRNNVLYETITPSTANTGIYGWNVSSGIVDDEIYTLKITWISPANDATTYDISSNFSIAKVVPVTTTTTTTTKMTRSAVGIDYSSVSDWVLIVLQSGLYMTFNLETMKASELLDIGVTDISTFCAKGVIIGGLEKQERARVWVGTAEGLNNMWDSGEITTDLTSIYYGGGNNLVAGEKYYLHIQIKGRRQDWGETQVTSFVMPN
jgi:hypothetical protein